MAKAKKPFVPDAVRDAQAIVTFYEKRLAEAKDRLAKAQAGHKAK